MFGYVIDLMLLTLKPKKADFPEVEHPWYADDAAAAVYFKCIRKMYDCLKELGPPYSYHLETSKSILLVAQHNLQ
jgi:hypothetical protein